MCGGKRLKPARRECERKYWLREVDRRRQSWRGGGGWRSKGWQRTSTRGQSRRKKWEKTWESAPWLLNRRYPFYSGSNRTAASSPRCVSSILNSEFYSVCIASPDLWRNRGLSLESLLWSPRAAVPPSPSLASLSVSLCCSVFAFPWAERAPRVFSTSTFPTFCAHLFHAGCPFSPQPSVRVSALLSFVCVCVFVCFSSACLRIHACNLLPLSCVLQREALYVHGAVFPSIFKRQSR